MLIRKAADLRYSDVTPREVYMNRRRFMGAAAGIAGAGAALLGGESAEAATTKLPNVTKSPLSTKDEKPSTIEAITTYNNYYEFGTGKDEPAHYAQEFKTSPWTLMVDGEVTNKKLFSY